MINYQNISEKVDHISNPAKFEFNEKFKIQTSSHKRID